MNAHRDPDRLIRDFVFEGAERLHDQVYDAIRAEIEQRPQRVVIGPWRMPIMNKLVPIGLGAAAVVVALVIGAQLLGPPAPSGVGGAPSTAPSATPSPTAAPSASEPSPSAAAGLPEGAFVVEDTGAADITVMIPSPGWTFDPEFLVVQKGREVENLPEAAILMWSWPAGAGFYVYGDPCMWASTKPDTPVTTVDDFAAALAAQPSRDASEPVDVTIGGYAGKSVTLHVPDDIDFSPSSPCDEDNFASYGAPGDEPARYHQGPGQIDELWILDVDGAIVVLDAMYRPNTPAELIDELRAIAESATFELP